MSTPLLRSMQPTAADLRRFKGTFDANGSPRDLARLQWQYLEGPVDQLLVNVAELDGAAEKFGAIYAVSPTVVDIGSSRSIGAQSLDTMTDVACRGQGLFKKLARSVYSRASSDKVALIYGFPNGNSAHGFFNRLDWTSLDPVPFLIRPLRLSYVISKLRPGWPSVNLSVPRLPHRLPRRHEIREITEFSPDFDELWDAFRTPDMIGVRRDARYLQWRLRQKPGVNYRCIGYYADGVLTAFAAGVVLEKHGGRIGYVVELLAHPGTPRAAARLLGHLLAGFHRAGADVALAWNFKHSPNHNAYQREGFVPLPEKVRPIELHFGVLPLSDEGNTARDRNRWYISYCDSDTV